MWLYRVRKCYIGLYSIMENENYDSILGLYTNNGNGNCYSILGLYKDNGKDNGNYWS